MNPSENLPAADATDWKQEYLDLQKRVNLLLFGMVILSFTLMAFLGLQSRRTSKDLEAMRPNALQIVEMNKQDGPRVDALRAKLLEYAKTHPEFATNLARAGITGQVPGGTTTTATPATPAPLAPPPIGTPTK